MHLLLPIASILGIEAEDLLERLKRGAIVWGAFAAFLVIGVAFALAGLNAALTTSVGPVWAPLIIAAGALAVAGGIYAAIRISADVAHRRQVERRHAAETTALVTTAAMTALPMVMDSPLMKKIGIPVGGALAAAWLLMKPGERTGRRRLQAPAED